MTNPRIPVRPAVLPFLLACGVGLALASQPAPDATSLYATGILSPATGTSTCMEETHVLTNPCTGTTTALLNGFFSSVPLDSYLCQYVSVAGSDVGVECPIIGVSSLAIVPPPACWSQAQSLVVSDPDSTWLAWAAMPCALSYDAIRGLLPGPAIVSGTVNLGTVVCLVNDLAVPLGSTPSTYNGPRDAEVPPPGQAFLYLIRATDQPYGATLYGFSSAGDVETPASGDCAL